MTPKQTTKDIFLDRVAATAKCEMSAKLSDPESPLSKLLNPIFEILDGQNKRMDALQDDIDDVRLSAGARNDA